MTPNEANEVWEMAHSNWPPCSAFRFFARKPHSTNAIYGGVIRNPAELAKATDWADNAGYNSYWQPNPTKKVNGTRCSSDDITHVSYFMVDIDPKGDDAYPSVMAIHIRDAMRELFDSAAPLEVYSGRGLQLLYPVVPTATTMTFSLGNPRRGVTLAEAAPIAFRFWLEELMRKVQGKGEFCNSTIDLDCVDLPRLMRMPYTINQKTGRRSAMSNAPAPSYSLLHSMITRAPEALWKPKKEPVYLGYRNHWIEYVPHMTVAGRRFLQEGSTSPGRHRAAAAAMLSLMDLGADESQVRGALYFGASLCEPPLPHSEVDDMVDRRFRKRRPEKFDTLVDSGPDVC